MAVRLIEKQVVDGTIREIGDMIVSDIGTEQALVAFGKATLIEDDFVHVQSKEYKGGKA